MQTNKKIEHVFVVMLENHSFDNMLGRADIPGVPPLGKYHNSYKGKQYPVSSPAPLSMSTDPGHELRDVLEQLTNITPESWKPPLGPYPRDKFPADFPNQTGFAANYATNTDEDNPAPPAPGEIGDVMKSFGPGQVPVLKQLAEEFAVCTRWHSSLPGPTWPNRFFVHLGTSCGLDATPHMKQIIKWAGFSGLRSPKGSIFKRLKHKGLKYRFYNDYISYKNHDSAFSNDSENGGGILGLGWIPQVQSLHGIGVDSSYELKEYFGKHLNEDYPFAYTFIEPHYGDLRKNTYYGGSSQHPMDNVYGGEALVKFVYETLRNSPLWDKSMLIITYDEHGGFYDSVAPPPAIPPDEGCPKYGQKHTLNKFGFQFDQLGVRVPALVISPYVKRNTVDTETIYDHTSVLATLETLFHLDPLTKRDENANNVLDLLSLDSPRTDCPTVLAEPAPASKRPIAAFTEAENALIDSQPIPDSGNLAGSMGILLKLHLEMAPKFFLTRWYILWRFRRLKTRGHLKSYAQEVAAMIQKRKNQG